ncbi:MAG TPA: NUDIX domain-containing protein [Ktedonobacterales bacterium]
MGDDMRADDMRADDMRAADCASRTEPQVRAPGSDDPEELFDLVDLHDRVIGQIRRSDAHRNPALLHRSVQILVFARDGRLLLQRRSQTKDLFPGYYCASASGHVASGEEYAAAARREIVEELGIAPKLRYVGKALVRSEPETELTALFLARCDGPFAFSPTETVGGAFFTLSELRAHRDNESLPLTPAAQVALDELDRLAREGILDAYLAGEQSP